MTDAELERYRETLSVEREGLIDWSEISSAGRVLLAEVDRLRLELENAEHRAKIFENSAAEAWKAYREYDPSGRPP